MVSTVVEPSMEASDDAAATGPSDDVGATAGAAMLDAHNVVRSARTTSHRPRCRNDCDFTLSPPRHGTAARWEVL
jgi:hypothetical protein